MSVEEARDLYTIRALLESFAAQQFALMASDEAVDALGAAVKELRRIAKNDRSQLVAAKTRLYDIIHAGCGSPLVASILQGLLTRINLLRATSLGQPQRLSRSLEEIDGIYAAIHARNAPLAKELAEQHVVNAQKAALAILEKQLAG
jgi:DNA-binding GntR family transcriptional regulator